MSHAAVVPGLSGLCITVQAAAPLSRLNVSLQLLADPWNDGNSGKHWPLQKKCCEREKQALKKPPLASGLLQWTIIVLFLLTCSMFSRILH